MLRRTRQAQRRMAGGKIDPVGNVGLQVQAQGERGAKVGDQPFAHFHLQRQQSVGRGRGQHHHLEKFLFRSGFARDAGIKRHRGLRELARFRQRIDLGDDAPHGLVHRSVAHVHPLHLGRQRAQRASEQERHAALQHVRALGSAGVEIDAAGVGEPRLAPVFVDRFPQTGFLELRLARRHDVVARQLAQVNLRRLVQQLHQLRAIFRFEAFLGHDRLEPMGQFVRALERVIARQFREDLSGLLDLGHGVIRFLASEQTDHARLAEVSGGFIMWPKALTNQCLQRRLT